MIFSSALPAPEPRRPPMLKTLKIALREYKATVRTKGFFIMLFVAPIFMSGSFIAITLLEGQVNTTDKCVAVIDHSGIIAEYLIDLAEKRNEQEVYDAETGKKIQPAYLLEKVGPNLIDPAAQKFELSEKIRNKKLYAFLEIGPEVAHPGEDREKSRIAFHGENTAMDDLRRWLRQPINDRLRIYRLQEAGINETDVQDLFTWVDVEGLGLVSIDDETGAVIEAKHTGEFEALIVPMIMVMMMMFMTMLGAMPLLSSVMEEKTQRIAEVILGSVRPFQFMMGKVLGGLGIALTGATVYTIVGLFAVINLGVETKVPLAALPWFFAFLVLHIIMMGSLASALGSICSDAKDAQNLSFPVLIPSIIPIFIMIPVLKEPLSSFSTWMSMIPPFTPMLMVMRLSTPMAIPARQPWFGITLVLLLAILWVWVGGLIFRVGILLQGTPPKLGNIIRWIARG